MAVHMEKLSYMLVFIRESHYPRIFSIFLGWICLFDHYEQYSSCADLKCMSSKLSCVSSCSSHGKKTGEAKEVALNNYLIKAKHFTAVLSGCTVSKSTAQQQTSNTSFVYVFSKGYQIKNNNPPRLDSITQVQGVGPITKHSPDW